MVSDHCDLDEQRAVVDMLAHRGPDGRGGLVFDAGGRRVFLGHTRLAVQDLSPAGAQPMASRDGRWLLSYNGEVYNHHELRHDLAGGFDSTGDTRTLVELLAAQGIDAAVRQLNGMFAFAALDRQEGKLHLVRDPLGIKPMYWASHGGRLAFASEVAPVLRLTGLGAQLDRAALAQFLTYRFCPSPATLWRGVRRLPPGHRVCYDIGTGRIDAHRYADLTCPRFGGSYQEAQEEYGRLLRGALHRQLRSDVPMGVLLSGGVDSALVAALAAEHGARLQAFTVGFDEAHPESEIQAAAGSARALGLDQTIVTLDADECWAGLTQAVRATEEPLGTASIIPMWFLSKRVARDVKVVLSGQGSDELWGGYRRHQAELLLGRVPHGFVWSGVRRAMTALPWRGDGVGRALRSLSAPCVADRYAALHSLFSPDELHRLGVRGVEHEVVDPGRRWLQAVRPYPGGRSIDRVLALDLRMSLPDDLLLYGDRISMAHSVEVRVPLLDLDLVRFTESLPSAYRLRWGRPKRTHRAVARGLLPAAVLGRKKLGFEVPFGTWARTRWRTRLEDVLLHQGFLDDVVDVRGVRTIWREHQRARPLRSRQLFALTSLALWAKTWIDRPVTSCPNP